MTLRRPCKAEDCPRPAAHNRLYCGRCHDPSGCPKQSGPKKSGKYCLQHWWTNLDPQQRERNYATNRRNNAIRDERRKALGQRHAVHPPVVYRWVMADGRTAYVGRGTKHRAGAHRTLSPWWTPDMRLVIRQCKNEWHAMEAEGRWGQRYQPIHNKDGYRR